MSTIRAGGLLVMDPSDIRVITFDWDAESLPIGVTISAFTHTITTIQQNGAGVLSKDNETLVTGNRKTQLRLNATSATAGDRYIVASKITTNEAPAQTIERQISVLIQNR